MQTFTKEERLSKKKIIEQLFSEGNNFVIHPFRVWYIHHPEVVKDGLPVQILISVSKRSIRMAVTRNLVKRKIREAYRKNKTWFYEGLQSSGLAIAFIYVANKPMKYDTIQEKIILVLKRLQKENEKTFG